MDVNNLYSVCTSILGPNTLLIYVYYLFIFISTYKFILRQRFKLIFGVRSCLCVCGERVFFFFLVTTNKTVALWVVNLFENLFIILYIWEYILWMLLCLLWGKRFRVSSQHVLWPRMERECDANAIKKKMLRCNRIGPHNRYNCFAVSERMLRQTSKRIQFSGELLQGQKQINEQSNCPMFEWWILSRFLVTILSNLKPTRSEHSVFC